MDQPLFSIVTVSYNSGQWIKQAIESVLNGGFADFEYILSDDCSTDDTWNIIQSYSDPRIKCFRQQTNLTEYPNRNFALGKATGKYLLFVDGDDYLYPDTLQKLSSYLEDYPQAGSVWGIYKEYFPVERLPIMLSPEQMIKWLYLANYPFGHFGFSETLFSVSLLKKMGGFPTHFIGGDTYIKKLVAVEQPVLMVPAGMMYWRMSPDQASSRLSRNYQGFRQNVNIEKEIIQRLDEKKLNVPIHTIRRNIAIRNVKLLFKHTFLKFKILDGIKLFRELGFKIADLRFLFVKGDYTYRKLVENNTWM